MFSAASSWVWPAVNTICSLLSSSTLLILISKIASRLVSVSDHFLIHHLYASEYVPYLRNENGDRLAVIGGVNSSYRIEAPMDVYNCICEYDQYENRPDDSCFFGVDLSQARARTQSQRESAAATTAAQTEELLTTTAIAPEASSRLSVGSGDGVFDMTAIGSPSRRLLALIILK